MAKKEPLEEDFTETAPIAAADQATDPVAPQPFVVPSPQNAPPTALQHQWLANHPNYIRISHSVSGRFTTRGTLTPDGEFIPEYKHPVSDGAGSFSVGI